MRWGLNLADLLRVYQTDSKGKEGFCVTPYVFWGGGYPQSSTRYSYFLLTGPVPSAFTRPWSP